MQRTKATLIYARTKNLRAVQLLLGHTKLEMVRSFEDIDDMNRQLRHWLDTVANVRCHGTTGRVVVEHFREEQPQLQSLPAGRFEAVLRVERRVSHEGCVSVGGNYYSVPDGTRKRVLDVETTPDTVRIFEDGALIATHARLEGRRERSVLAGHRLLQRIMQREKPDAIVLPPGHAVAQRPLAVYEFIGRQIGGLR
jgi:hypothetical protein